MTTPPPFFDQIQALARRRWDQLEADPDLAGPWHQLFKQVQSPRHILSELLQNADDAGATEASVRIDDHALIFTHNGQDFTDEHFGSLCRFGFSNKRALHTIGFRGIGFKSTFSLGDTVELYTPTLAVAFDRRRFTEPRWLNTRPEPAELTQVRVAISDTHREREVAKNLEEWLRSPVSLLFFRNLRRLRVSDQEIHWGSLGAGPVPDTEWMALNDNAEQAFMLARSGAESFPPDAIAEIRQERLVSDDQEGDFPPSKVELVLGAKGRLYVVLPTGVETDLPFACNAPFIQDPARLKIKDPETSPTNRWLLERIGSLAASAMIQWLEHPTASLVERSQAYTLLPDVDREDETLEGICATAVELVVDREIKGRAVVLTNTGVLQPKGQVLVLPDELFDVWPEDQVSALLDSKGRSPLARNVSSCDRLKLERWGLVESLTKSQVLDVLGDKHLPQPASWAALLKLWAYIAPEITNYGYFGSPEELKIVPVQGHAVLYAADEAVRLGERRLLQSDADWEFLSKYLRVADQRWSRYLAEQRRMGEEKNDAPRKVEVAAGYAVLDAIGLNETSDVGDVIDRVASEFFAQKNLTVEDCVRLAQIAAKLGAEVKESFRFVARDNHLRQALFVDPDGVLESLMPIDWCSRNLLSEGYGKAFTACTAEDWRRWTLSGAAGLAKFPAPKPSYVQFWGRDRLTSEVARRGISGPLTYPYKPNSFRIEDWDFDRNLWDHWTDLAREDARVWERIVDRILVQPEAVFAKTKNARALQFATTGSTRPVTYEPLLPAWVLKLRELPCLPGTRGVPHKPSSLMRRTPATEALLDVEPFVHGLVDTEAARPMLKLLGVRDTPAGPDTLLSILRSLAQSAHPPADDVDKWHRRLDQMFDSCSTTDQLTIKVAFRKERLILTDDGTWAAQADVFLHADEEDVPGAALIRAAVRELSLWRKLGVAERPTADLAIAWLNALPEGKPLSQNDGKRVRALLVRYPGRVWNECGRWLNLAREWVAVEKLDFALTMQSLVPWSHLYEDVKRRTADFQSFTSDTIAEELAALPPLASALEERLQVDPRTVRPAEPQPWLNRLGAELSRINLPDLAEQERVRALARDLARTLWRITPGLEVIPYLEGAPVGTPRRTEVVWRDGTLYVERLPTAKLARLVPEALARLFSRQDIGAALSYAFQRPPENVAEYVEENFDLGPTLGASGTDSERTDQTQPRPAGEQATPKRRDESLADARDLTHSDPDDSVVTDVAPSPSAEMPGGAKDDDMIDITPASSPLRRPPQSAPPSLIERFALAGGFRPDGEDRFFHADGSWIGKTQGEAFPWERRAGNGEPLRYYWPKDHCLEHEPLQLDAALWSLIDKFPDTYSLVLSGPDGEPVETSGARLRTLRDAGQLKLFPAAYRLAMAAEPGDAF